MKPRPGGPYDGHQCIPADHLLRAEKLLVVENPPPEDVALASALIALAGAMMTGSMRR
jgi:hypothetical protein